MWIRALIGIAMTAGTALAGWLLMTPDKKAEEDARKKGCICQYGRLTMHVNKRCPLHGHWE
jgi:hypothetical protein